MNTIVRYLLEEKFKYEKKYTNFLYISSSDAHLFNNQVPSIDDLGREINALQSVVTSRLLHFEQSSYTYRLLLTDEIKVVTGRLEENLLEDFQSLKSINYNELLNEKREFFRGFGCYES